MADLATQSKLSNVWQTLRDSQDISKALINDLQAWVQKEEFDFDALVDDLNDKEDESSICQWLNDANHNKNAEFTKIRELVTPSKYLKKNNKYYAEDEKSNVDASSISTSNIQIDDTRMEVQYGDIELAAGDKQESIAQPAWSGLPKVYLIQKPANERREHDKDDQSMLMEKSEADKKDKSNMIEFAVKRTESGEPDVFDLMVQLNTEFQLSSHPDLAKQLMTHVQAVCSSSLINFIRLNKDDLDSEEIAKRIEQSQILPISGIGGAAQSEKKKETKPEKVDGNDLDAVRAALAKTNKFTEDELSEFVRHCKDEEYGEDQLVDDLEVFEDGDCAIIEHMSNLFDWNSAKAARFVNALRSVLGLLNQMQQTRSSSDTTPGGPTPGGPSNSTNTKTQQATKTTSSATTTQGGAAESEEKDEHKTESVWVYKDFTEEELKALPRVCDFEVPQRVIRQVKEREWDDIEDIFRANGVAEEIISHFTEFANENPDLLDMNYSPIQHGPLLRQSYPQCGELFAGYLDKIYYEIQKPKFVPVEVTHSEIDQYYAFMQKECPGVIQHDKQLLKFFLSTNRTEPGLSSILQDIRDRLSVEDDHQLDANAFLSNRFFADCDKKQKNAIKNGLRSYSHRFFSRLETKPRWIIADKLSDYQNYACILSQVVKRLIDEKVIKPPMMMDFMLVPPGVYGVMSDQNFNAANSLKLGSIKQHLDDFENSTYQILSGAQHGGLSADSENFNAQILERTVANIVDAIKKVIAVIGDKKQYQRFVVIVDRRWRVLNKKHVIYNKLRWVHSKESEVSIKGCYDEAEYKNDPGLVRKENNDAHYTNSPYDEGEEDIAMAMLMGGKQPFIDFGNESQYAPFINDGITNDTIYVFQPQCPAKRKVAEFDQNFTPETLTWFTKYCVLPRKDDDVSSKFNAFQSDYGNHAHITGQSIEGNIFNIAVHVYPPYPNNIWYKYQVRWYLFTAGASVRILDSDFTGFLANYFADSEKDKHRYRTAKEMKRHFAFPNLVEADPQFKRWFYAVKRAFG